MLPIKMFRLVFYATLTRMPLFNFPRIWNMEGLDKFNPIQHHHCNKDQDLDQH
jgi:hypothetical protein